MNDRFVKCLALCFAGLLFAEVAAQEWTRFRGPNGSGVSRAKSIPETWIESDVNWKVKLPGIGHSSPVVWGNRLFVQSANPDTAGQFIVCLDAITGQTKWQKSFEINAYHIHTRSSFASATPTVDGHAVYVAWSTAEQTTLSAFSHKGELIWQQHLGPYISSHGFGTSPILYEDLVIVCHQQRKPARNGPRTETSSIVALDRSSGDPRWRTKLWSDKASYSVPCILKQAEKPDELICCSTTDGIFSLNPSTGKKNWSNEVFSMRTVSSPLIAGGLVFGTTGSGGGGNYVVALNPKTQKVVYEVKRHAPYVPGPVAYNDMGFLWSDDGIVTCFDIASGKPFWTERIGGNFSGSPVVVNGKVYCISDDGRVCVIAAAKEFELLGKTPLGEDSRGTPAVANGRMYLRTYSHITCIGKPGAV